MRKFLALLIVCLVSGFQNAQAECNGKAVEICSKGVNRELCKQEKSLYYIYQMGKIAPSLSGAFVDWLAKHKVDVCKENVDQISSLFSKAVKDEDFIVAFLLRAEPGISREKALELAKRMAE